MRFLAAAAFWIALASIIFGLLLLSVGGAESKGTGLLLLVLACVSAGVCMVSTMLDESPDDRQEY